jgi:hypothetical protein
MLVGQFDRDRIGPQSHASASSADAAMVKGEALTGAHEAGSASYQG